MGNENKPIKSDRLQTNQSNQGKLSQSQQGKLSQSQQGKLNQSQQGKLSQSQQGKPSKVDSLLKIDKSNFRRSISPNTRSSPSRIPVRNKSSAEIKKKTPEQKNNNKIKSNEVDGKSKRNSDKNLQPRPPSQRKIQNRSIVDETRRRRYKKLQRNYKENSQKILEK